MISLTGGILIGLVFYVRIFSMFHEHMHGVFLDDKFFLGNSLRLIVRVLMLVDPALWKAGHNKHHKEIGNFSFMYGIISKDEYLSLTQKKRKIYHLLRNSVFLFLLGYFSIFIIYFNLLPFVYKKKLGGVLSIASHFLFFILISSYVGYLNGFSLVVLPAIVAAMLGIKVLYLQHIFKGAFYIGERNRPLTNRIYETTSMFVAHPFLLWCIGNQEHHHIHHINPKIPFYRHKEMYQKEKELQDCCKLELTIENILGPGQCFVWDSEAAGFITKENALSAIKKHENLASSHHT